MPRRIPDAITEIGRTDTLTVGAKKALSNFITEYGTREGERIFIAKAVERGTGTTVRQKVNSIYKTGAKLK